MAYGSGLNDRAVALADAMIAEAQRLRLAVSLGPLGETLVDAGGRAAGGIEAGLQLARIAMAGLGSVELGAADGGGHFQVMVRSSQPVLACLASQYAGWSLAHDKFFALGSGPARALARRETLFEHLALEEQASRAVLVLESASPPPPALVAQIARDCRLDPARLTIFHASTQSLAGSTQVVARVLEVALHKAHELQFPLEHIVDGMGTAPLAPPHPDFITAMGRTNDAIIYGGRVHLFVNGPADAAQALAQAMPSSASSDFGQPFAEIFRRFDGDFYKIDPMLFSPAAIAVTALESGQTFRAGQVKDALLAASFA
ncbi:MAG: methenyltetrahydromethanopterin cyclohydrolase [Hyphomicrobiales bacterium]|nr:methenyltetrahydromethanopterin cyclohydrolase [Hyphomicrobiales bacterium]